MNLLYKDRPKSETDFISQVCNYILSQPYKPKYMSNEFAGIFVEGRSRDFCLEDAAALYSFHSFSQFNYPVFCFLADSERFLRGINEFERERNIDLNLVVIQIPALNSLEEYSDFCIKKLYFMLPEWVKNVLTLQGDAMLISEGWENWITDNKFEFIGPHFKHCPAIDVYINNEWNPTNYQSLPFCNGGLSFRKVSVMREISKKFSNLKQRERFTEDKEPQEDLFYSFWGFNSKLCKLPTLKESCQFAIDPLDFNMFKEFKEGKRHFYGFHYLKQQSEFPYCNH